MAATLSGSGIGRGARCPASYALPCVNVDSDDATRGRAVHAYLEQLVRGVERETALATVPEEIRKRCEPIPLAEIPRADAEVSFAYDVLTGRARKTATTGRAYEVTASEIPGTADVVVWAGGPTVMDWKTVNWDLDVEASWPQLEFYGLCAARVVDSSEATVEIVTVADNGELTRFTRHLDWEDLGAIAKRVRRVWDRVQAVRIARAAHESASASPWLPDVTKGAHCRYCPASLHCPATRAAIATLRGLDLTAELSREDVAEGWLAAREAEQVASVVRGIAGETVDSRGALTLPDGRVIRRDSRRALRLFGSAA